MLLKIAVITELDVAQQIPAHGIGSALLQQTFRIEHVAEGFAHLLTLTGEKSMAEHMLGNRKSGGHQHRRPVDRMETEDVLADHVHGRRPAAIVQPVEVRGTAVVQQGRQIPKQGIKPNIKGMAFMVGNRQTPGHVHPGDREVAQPLGHEIAHFLPTTGGLNEVIAVDESLDLRLITRQAEEQVFLIPPLERFAMDGAIRLHRISGIVLEFLAADAVPTGLTSTHHIARCLDPFVELMDKLEMARVRGADKAVLTDPPALPQIAVGAADGITVILRRLLLCLGGALDLLTVFIHPRDKRHGITAEPPIPSQRITGDGRVGTAQMGAVIDVIKRRREGVGHLELRYFATRRDAGS